MREGTSEGLPMQARARAWRAHLSVVAIILLAHLAVLYFMTRPDLGRELGADGPPLLRPIISETWVPERPGITSRPWNPAAQADRSAPPTRWRFPAVDLWPSAPGWSATLSEFTPVTDAQPDPPEMTSFMDPKGRLVRRPAFRHSPLRMTHWLRPGYLIDCAPASAGRVAVLDLLIDPSGQPIEVRIEQGSGLTELDDAALRAAPLWRFSAPVWQSRPVQVSARIELRFNC